MNALVPLFAIGVFVGFTLAQVGMVRHWRRRTDTGVDVASCPQRHGCGADRRRSTGDGGHEVHRGRLADRRRAPLLVVGMERVRAAYEHIGERLTLGPDRMDPRVIGSPTIVLVPVSGVTELSRMALSAAVTMTSQPVAIRVCFPGDSTSDFARQWQERYPYTELILIEDTDNSVGLSLARYVRTHFTPDRVSVILATIEPAVTWHRLLPTQRVDEIARALRKHSDAMVCQIAFRIDPAHRNPSLRA